VTSGRFPFACANGGNAPDDGGPLEGRGELLPGVKVGDARAPVQAGIRLEEKKDDKWVVVCRRWSRVRRRRTEQVLVGDSFVEA
jgi:hypothetical protein